jgi:hypothetical protein
MIRRQGIKPAASGDEEKIAEIRVGDGAVHNE